jgi:hypothetical protein
LLLRQSMSDMTQDYAEDQARRRRPMTMRQWVERLDAFLGFNERDILTDAGRVSHAVAERLALDEFDNYEAARHKIEATQPTSDFDRLVEQTKRLELGAETKNKSAENSLASDLSSPNPRNP